MICFECRKTLAFPKDNGAYTARKASCNYCFKEKSCMPDRHFVFREALKQMGYIPVAIKKIDLMVQQKDFVRFLIISKSKIVIHFENKAQEINVWGKIFD